jgi:chloride channel 3/4/5
MRGLTLPGSVLEMRHHSRSASWTSKLIRALRSDRNGRRKSIFDISDNNPDDRVWYDQFTSTDWVHDNIADAFRRKELRSRKGFRGRLTAFFDGSQGWILSALVGFSTACIAYGVDITEAPAFDLKSGYCSRGWYMSDKACCPQGMHQCDAWRPWSSIIKIGRLSEGTVEFLVYLVLVVLFATLSCLLTITTKTVVSSSYRISTLDENLGAIDRSVIQSSADAPQSPTQAEVLGSSTPPMVYYSASGSGVAEVKVILSGFVLHGFLGLKTLVIKTAGLILSVASGLSLGKEGPFVHIASCVGNIACRLFDKYDHNDSKRREVLSAAAASGLAVAFGAPIGGVLFSLEETSYFFPAKTLFRTFFCCITAALTLKFLNPYGTGKIVMFEVRYVSDWEFFEMAPFVMLGIIGGAIGALFIKAARVWATTFRRIPAVKRYPLVEVMAVAAITGLIGYWNPYTNSAVAKLLLNLASPCDPSRFDDSGLCPSEKSEIMAVVTTLFFGLIIKGFLTIITFGIVSVPLARH